MAGYNPSAFYGAVFDASNRMLDEKDQQRKDMLTALSNAATTVPKAIQTQRTNELIKSATDPETGMIDKQKYIAGLSQIDPQKALELQQTYEDKALNKEYKQAQIDRLGTQASNDALTGQKIQAQTQTENARYTTQQAMAFAKNLDNNLKMTSNLMSVLDGVNTQADYDSMINAAERSGIASPEIIEQFKGQTLTPELKQQVKSLLMTNKDNVEQARKQLLTEHQVQNLDNQSANRDANTAINTAKLQETMDNNDNNDLFKERQVSNQEKATQAQIDANNLARQDKKDQSAKENNSKVIEAQKQYESNIQATNNVKRVVNKILSNPALDEMSGSGSLSEMMSSVPSKAYVLAGTAKRALTGESESPEEKKKREDIGNPYATFKADLEQLKSEQFLQNIQSMRGLGALSDAEGKKINAAAGVINFNISKAELVSQLNTMITSANKMQQLDGKYLNEIKSNFGGSNNSTNSNSSVLTSSNNSGNMNTQAPVSSGTPSYSSDQLSKFQQWKNAGLQ